MRPKIVMVRNLNVVTQCFVNSCSVVIKLMSALCCSHVTVISSHADAPSEKNVRSKGLNGITSAMVAEQIMDNSLRIADASSGGPSNLGKDLATVQPTADGQCNLQSWNKMLSQNVTLVKNRRVLETNIGKQHHLSGYKIQEFREKEISLITRIPLPFQGTSC